jgi:hypothetical protein
MLSVGPLAISSFSSQHAGLGSAGAAFNTTRPLCVPMFNPPRRSATGPHQRKSGPVATLPGGGYQLKSCDHMYPMDWGLAVWLARFFLSHGAHTVLELGAGCGCYSDKQLRFELNTELL